MSRFDGALAATLPPPPPAWVRVLGQTLSPAARRAFRAAQAEWRTAPPPSPALQLLSPDALRDSLADEVAVMKALRAYINAPQAREKRRDVAPGKDTASGLTLLCALQDAAEPLPADLPCHPGVVPFILPDDDDRMELRGQARRCALHCAQLCLTRFLHRSAACARASRSRLASWWARYAAAPSSWWARYAAAPSRRRT